MKNVVSMLISVAIWGFYPLLATFALEDISPILLVFLVYVASLPVSIAICAPYLGRVFRRVSAPGKRRLRLIIVGNGLVWGLLHFSLYAALSSAPQVPVVIVYEIWPAILVVLAPLIIGDAFKSLSTWQWLLSAVAFVGVILATAETPENLSALVSGQQFLQFGLVLAAVAAICQAVNSSVMALVARELSDLPVFPAAVAAETIVRFFSAPVFGVILLTTGEIGDISSLNNTDWFVVIAIGVLVFSLGSAFCTQALASANSATIAILWYLVPVLSVLFLSVFGKGVLTSFSVIGVGLVVIANLFLTTGSLLPTATTGSVILLFSSFYAAYLTRPVEIENLFGVLEITSVFFAVLVSFIMDRFRQAIRESEKLIIKIGEELTLLSEAVSTDSTSGQLRMAGARLLRRIIDIDYERSRKKIDLLMDTVSDELASIKELALEGEKGEERRARLELITRLDRSLHNWLVERRYQMTFGEQLTLVILAAFSISAAFVGRPDTLYGDIFGVVIATSVGFVTLQVLEYNIGAPIRNLQDVFLLQRGLHQLGEPYYLPERLRPTPIGMQATAVYRAQVGADRDLSTLERGRGSSQGVATVVLVIISLVFLALLASKHLLLN